MSSSTSRWRVAAEVVASVAAAAACFGVGGCLGGDLHKGSGNAGVSPHPTATTGHGGGTSSPSPTTQPTTSTPVGPPSPTIARVDSVANGTQDFGWSLAISGDTLLVGSRLVPYGVVYRNVNGAWQEEAHLDAPDGVDAVAVDGDLAVTTFADGGVARVYRRSGATWTQEAMLTGSSAGSGSLFGNAVAISGGTIVVGARENIDGKPGSAYVFVSTGGGWIEQAVLAAAEPAANDQFGFSVAISGDTIAVAAPRDHTGPHFAYVFERAGGAWTPSAIDVGTAAAISVALSGDTLVTGDNYSSVARVFVRTSTGWAPQGVLQAEPGTNFGYTVAVSGDVAAASTLSDSTDSHAAAFAYVRHDGVWSPATTLLPSGAVPTGFGNPVAASGAVIAVGAPYDGPHAELPGSVWTFTMATH